MFKKFFNEIKAVVDEVLEETEYEQESEDDSEQYTGTFCVAGSSVAEFKPNMYLDVTIDSENFVIETPDSETEDGFCISVPIDDFAEISYKTYQDSGRQPRGTYLAFDIDHEYYWIQFKADAFRPHHFLEVLQKYRMLEEMNAKRYARTAISNNALCSVCSGVIGSDGICPHCGMKADIEEEVSASDFEYWVEPRYSATLELHSTSISNLSIGDRVFYEVYEDCLALRIHGNNVDYIPQNIIILFENITETRNKTYDHQTDSSGLYISFKENTTQYVQLKHFSSDPTTPQRELEQHMKSFNPQDVVDAVETVDGAIQRKCDYCDLVITTSICPHCGGVNL